MLNKGLIEPKLYLLFFAFLVLLFAQSWQVKAQSPPSITPFDPNQRLFGLTIDNVGDMPAINEALKQLRKAAPGSPLPIIRIVFDMGEDPKIVQKEYFDAVMQIRSSNNAYIMAELVDSHFEASEKCFSPGTGNDNLEKSRNCYKERAKAYFSYIDPVTRKNLRDYVDIWEIGNEINGEWYGERKPVDTKFHRKVVMSQIEAAYSVFVDDSGKKLARTAVTFYFNGDSAHHSYENEDYSMLEWIKDGENYFKNVDYVLISYYEDDNFDTYVLPNGKKIRRAIEPSWEEWAGIFDLIHTKYKSAMIGFGEFGSQCHHNDSNDKCGVIDPDKYIDPETPGEIVSGTCPAASSIALRNFSEESDSLWKRDCECCLLSQRSYIPKYYSYWDREIRAAIERGEYDKDAVSRFKGGYFYWHFNPDVIDKVTFANRRQSPRREKERQKINADRTLKAIKDAYAGYFFNRANPEKNDPAIKRKKRH